MSYEVEIIILSGIASMGSLIKLIPQIYHIYKKPEHAKGLSGGMLFCGTISGFASIGIGILKKLPYYIGGYSAVTLGYVILARMKCKYNKYQNPDVVPIVIDPDPNLDPNPDPNKIMIEQV